MLREKKKIKIASVVLTFVMAVSIFTGITLNADAQVLLEESNPDFQYFVNYKGDPMKNDAWTPNAELCKLTYDTDSKNYTFTSNAYVMWGNEDNVSYAYNKYRLDNGDQGTITTGVKILEHSTTDPSKEAEMHENASIGICMRGTTENNGLYDSNKSSQEIYLHCRADKIMVVYRSKDGNTTAKGSPTMDITTYPVYLKMVKEGNAVKCSAKMGEDGVWKNFTTVYLSLPEVVTVGMAAHSVSETISTTSVFTDYSLSIEGPAGSTYTPVTDGYEDGGEAGEEENLDDVIMDDPALTEGILFRETFTDGSLVNESTDGEEHIDNPIWSDEYSIEGNAAGAKIVTEDGNRYWHRPFSSDAYIFPNLEWSDYSMEVDLKFGPDTSLETSNAVDLYVRTNAARATGYYGYRVAMRNTYNEATGASVQSVSIYKICGRRSLVTTSYLCTSVKHDYICYDWSTWRVEAFDNRIGVYQDDVLVLEFTEERGSEIGSYAVNGLGGIGIGSEAADLMIDNIIVREMEDLLGGSYDNSIAGRWEQAIPDYILNYAYELD